MKHGFSLVELSIVLVILGLLTGGILAGQSLIRASELRAVSIEVNRYITASQSFRDKYFATPGDMNTATKFWTSAGGTGSDSVCGGSNTANATCNGDGDGLIEYPNGANVFEANRFWQQLALAGLIEGSYTGVNGFAGGTDLPGSKLGSAIWRITSSSGTIAGSAFNFGGDYGNALFLFIFSTVEKPLKPEEAWNIDTKMDDGLPGGGKIYAEKGNGTSIICTTGDNVAPPGDASATYVLSRANKDCSLIFLRAF